MINFMTKQYTARGYFGRLANVWPYGTDKPNGLIVNIKLWVK